MKRTPLRPGQGLERGTPLARTAGPTRPTRLTAKGRSRFPKRRDPAYCKWVRSLPCLLRGWTRRHDDGTEEIARPCWGRVEAAHVCGKTRGAGAYDRGEVAPLCRLHHAEQEGRTARFEHNYGLSPMVIAKQLEARYVLRDFGGLSGSAGERTHE